jgi:hypothetical protein
MPAFTTIPVIRLLCATLVMSLFGVGCGTIQHENVSNTSRKQIRYKTKSGRQVRVVVGTVSTDAKLGRDLQNAVSRYLIDQAKAIVGQHSIFTLADTSNAGASLLNQYMQTDSAPSKPAEVDATLDVKVLSLKESKGATIKVGLVSRQSKKATAVVEATLRLANGRIVSAKAKGTNTKGAVGVVAMVNRKAMSKTGGVWELDGSMAGGACTKALEICINELARGVHRDLRRLTPDAADRFLRPTSVSGRR